MQVSDKKNTVLLCSIYLLYDPIKFTKENGTEFVFFMAMSVISIYCTYMCALMRLTDTE